MNRMFSLEEVPVRPSTRGAGFFSSEATLSGDLPKSSLGKGRGIGYNITKDMKRNTRRSAYDLN
jgi:hypothetical protein